MNALIVPIPHRSISATSSGQMLSWWCLYSGRASASSRRVNAFRIIRLPPYWCSLYESEGRSGVAIGWNRFRQTPAWQPSGLPSLGVAASRSTPPEERAAPRGVTKHVTREAGGPLAWLWYGGGGKDSKERANRRILCRASGTESGTATHALQASRASERSRRSSAARHLSRRARTRDDRRGRSPGGPRHVLVHALLPAPANERRTTGEPR